MNEKETRLPVSTKIEPKLIEKIEQIAERNNMTRSKQIRIAIKKFIEIVERMRSGEIMMFFDPMNKDEKITSLKEINQIREMCKDCEMSQKTRDIIYQISSRLEDEYIIQCQRENPEERGFIKIPQ